MACCHLASIGGGEHWENCGRASRDEQGASIEGIPTNGRRFTYYEESNTLGTISMGELYTKCKREQHQLKMASYCDNLGDQGNQATETLLLNISKHGQRNDV